MSTNDILSVGPSQPGTYQSRFVYQSLYGCRILVFVADLMFAEAIF